MDDLFDSAGILVNSKAKDVDVLPVKRQTAMEMIQLNGDLDIHNHKKTS